MEEFRPGEHGCVISPLSTLFTGGIPQQMTEFGPAISQVNSMTVAEHGRRLVTLGNGGTRSARIGTTMQPFFRLLCATAISFGLTSGAAAEALMLMVSDARAARDPRTGRAVVTIKLSRSSTQAFAAFTAARRQQG
jgi:hypothetical protein